MAETKNIAVLFDFDGVVVDTETQYSVFWHKMGVDYLGMEDLESRVKGQTLMYIYDTFFPGMTKEREEITVGLDRFEQDMSYDFVPGVEEFIADLHRNGVKMAVVTSSNDKKMEAVYTESNRHITMNFLQNIKISHQKSGLYSFSVLRKYFFRYHPNSVSCNIQTFRLEQ